MPRYLIAHERTASQLLSPVRNTARPPPRVPLTNKTAGTVYLGTVLSETVATVLLSVPSTVACREQLAHSRTTGTN